MKSGQWPQRNLWSIVGSITVLLTMMEGKYKLEAGTMMSVALLFMAREGLERTRPIISRSLSKSDPQTMERFINIGFLIGLVFFSLIPLPTRYGWCVFFLWVVILVVQQYGYFHPYDYKFSRRRIRGRIFPGTGILPVNKYCFYLRLFLALR